MEEKKFQSIVRKVVLFPLSVLVIIRIITIASCFISFFNMQQQMTDSNINSLQITYVTTKNISLGILIPQKMIISSIPTVNKIIFLVAFLSLFLVPVVIIWLQRKIARPVRDIDKAMKIIGEGDMDYRIPMPDKKYYDEFDRLIVRFNKMMDELNDLEFHLYKTKIREQRTELKYISQQIRPHFILNALNIIYTYDEEEFPLVKKMVLYLTDYFRYIVNLRVDFVELVKEMRHAENYLKIQKERYPEQLDFLWNGKHESMIA